MKCDIMSGNKIVASVEDKHITILDEALVPLYLKRTGNFEKWVSDRAIDAARPNSRVLKKVHGLSRTASDFDTAMLYNAACVTDNFWVRKGTETWEDVKFNNSIYFKAAVLSDVDVFNFKPSKSPELTNTGSREKGWQIIDGDWWLYKNEPEERAKFEVLTSRIGQSLGFDMAYYELEGGLIRAKDVTEGKLNLQSIDALVYDHDGITDENMEYNFDVLYKLDPAFAGQYMDIKYLDVLTNNVDRHTKNYAVMTSQATGEILRLAPNYDNDMAFYGYPDILNRDRIHGEMAEFLILAVKVGYMPPELDEKYIEAELEKLGMDASIKDYLVNGQRVVKDRVSGKCFAP